MSNVAVSGTGTTGSHSISLERPPFVRFALVALMALLVAGALVAMVIVLRGEFSDPEGKVLAIVAGTFVFSGVALPSVLHLENGRYRLLSGLGGSLHWRPSPWWCTWC